MSKTWNKPVNQTVHDQLTSQGFIFVESRWENEFAVSRYRGPNGEIKRVEEKGKILDGEAKSR